MNDRTAITIRLPRITANQLREEYARTFPLHRLNWNNWLLSRIQSSFTIKDSAVNPPLTS